MILYKGFTFSNGTFPSRWYKCLKGFLFNSTTGGRHVLSVLGLWSLCLKSSDTLPLAITVPTGYRICSFLGIKY